MSVAATHLAASAPTPGRGRSTKTPGRVAEAIYLREVEGLEYREIGARLGVSTQTAFAWVDDPDGSKLKARKDGYRVPCSVCGAPTDGSTGHRESGVCQRCAPEYHSTWTKVTIKSAICRWADDHGGIPPSANEFQNAKRRGANLPTVNEVVRHFASWKSAIVEAGYQPHAGGPVGGYTALTASQRRACARRYRRGESSVDIAADMGCTSGTVIKWVRHYGVEVRPNFIDAARVA